MENNKSYIERLTQWLQGLIPTTTPQESDNQVEVDKDGFFFHVACNNCDYHLRLRVGRSYDLERLEGGGYHWQKTIVDGRCFRKMQATVQFDNAYGVVEKEIEGGRFVTRSAWEANR
jgi:hypothetical protein